jgi:hypothetical protein
MAASFICSGCSDAIANTSIGRSVKRRERTTSNGSISRQVRCAGTSKEISCGIASGITYSFLKEKDPAKGGWDAALPTHRTGPNWDAIGRLRYGIKEEWLLVEAKANTQELLSECGAKDTESIKLIRKTLNRTKAALGVAGACDWMRPYYQFCNRLAVLHVLSHAGSASRLLYIYFCGDVGDGGRTCPASEAEWTEALAKLGSHVGLPANHSLNNRIHKCFIDARCVD